MCNLIFCNAGKVVSERWSSVLQVAAFFAKSRFGQYTISSVVKCVGTLAVPSRDSSRGWLSVASPSISRVRKCFKPQAIKTKNHLGKS